MFDKAKKHKYNKNAVKETVFAGKSSKITITALFHSENNFIIELNSGRMLLGFKRFYC